MTLENVFLIPHGDEILDHPNGNSVALSNKIREVTAQDNSKTIVVISPHGLKLSNSIGVINTQFLKANLTLKTRRIQKRYETDRELAARIVASSTLTQEASFITASGPLSVFPLDFGTVIPLQFFSRRKLVSIGQPRIWDLPGLVEFGMVLGKVVDQYPEKTTIIISADQAHTHAPEGIYGYADEAKPYEDLVEKCIKESDLSPLLNLKKDFVEKAKPDSYWNMLILKGIMDYTGKRSILDYHYVECYFGMLLGHLA